MTYHREVYDVFVHFRWQGAECDQLFLEGREKVFDLEEVS
jgi:hypothetical protein